MRSVLAFSASIFLFSTVATFAQNLSPQSQQELQRVFGTGGATSGLPTTVQASPPRQGLTPQSVEELRRVLGQGSIAGTAQMQQHTTPETINSTVLLQLLKNKNDPIRFYILWHSIAVDITAIDHKATFSASPNTFHEQFGPARTARALAIVHQAMFEAANVFEANPKYKSTIPGLNITVPVGASRHAAITEAAYQTLLWLYPGLNDQPIGASNPDPVTMPDPCFQSNFSLSLYYTCSLKDIGDTPAARAGISVGRAVAGRILADRSHDGAEQVELSWNVNFAPSRTDPTAKDYAFRQWQIDPVSRLNIALGANWSYVKPFAMSSGFQFRPEDQRFSEIVKPIIDAKTTDDYKNLASYNAIYRWGRDVRLDGSGKTLAPGESLDGFFVAQFWAYDATANLCAPARLYNQIARAVLDHIRSNPSDAYNAIDVNSVTDVARYFALINMAMADAANAAWDAKYHFQFPRPVTYIRAVEASKNPSPQRFPLGAQITNSDQPYNITPPFPSYPSGHAVFGGALFGILRQFIKPDEEFEFQSDEFNGKNRDVYNYVRCAPNEDRLTDPKFCKKIGRKFTVNCAERENADSRLFMGVHWVFDADDGIAMGNKVAKQAYETLMVGGGKPVLYSADDTKFQTRDSLRCSNINYPLNWDNTDPKIGFGPLKIERVQ